MGIGVLAVALKERMAEIRDGRSLGDTALTTGDRLLAEPGCEAWAKTEGPDGRMRWDGEARGGIILEVVRTPVVDHDTGECGYRRAFRCYDYDPRTPDHQRISTLTEAQIAEFEPANVARLRNIYRGWCREIGKRSGIATSAEIDMCQDVARLAAIVGQRTR